MDPASIAYGSLAPYYDAFTRGYEHERWLASLTERARALGLPSGPVLDVACGTGKSLKPLIGCGFDVVGCDLSPEMLDVARHALPGVPLVEADMRQLPDLGRFAWVTCLNDALNCLLHDDDLRAAFASIASLMVDGGLLTFDLNSSLGHRRAFTGIWTVEEPDTFMCWTGRGCDDGPQAIGRSDIVIFHQADGQWQRTVSPHRERHWSTDDVATAATAAGLEITAVYGQRTGCIVDAHVDEQVHTKLVYFLRRTGAASRSERR